MSYNLHYAKSMKNGDILERMPPLAILPKSVKIRSRVAPQRCPLSSLTSQRYDNFSGSASFFC